MDFEQLLSSAEASQWAEQRFEYLADRFHAIFAEGVDHPGIKSGIHSDTDNHSRWIGGLAPLTGSQLDEISLSRPDIWALMQPNISEGLTPVMTVVVTFDARQQSLTASSRLSCIDLADYLDQDTIDDEPYFETTEVVTDTSLTPEQVRSMDYALAIVDNSPRSAY